MTISLGQSQTLTGTWKMSPQAGAFLVGPAQGSNGYFQNSAADVVTRACYFDDEYIAYKLDNLSCTDSDFSSYVKYLLFDNSIHSIYLL